MPRARPLDLDRIERHVAESAVRYSSLDRVVFPETEREPAALKAHVLDYYLRVADHVLPHLVGRPIVFRRYPDGIGGPFFYTKDWPEDALPPPVTPLRVWSETRDEPMTYALVENADALGWLVQMGAVEAHAWLSRVGADPDACASARGLESRECGLDRPDVMLFDVDPYASGGKRRDAGGEPGLDPADWSRAVDAALELKDVLDGLGAPSFVKTSGKRGVHVVVPIVADEPYGVVRAFARTVAEHVVRRRPDLATLAYDASARRGRVFLDVNQNVRGKTIAAAYSLRPTPEASVSMPVAWRDLARVDPAEFTMTSVPLALERGHDDPWRGLDDARVPLRALAQGGAR